MPVEHLNDLLGDHEAEPDSVFVELLRFFDEAKEFEELGLVLVLDAYSCVFDRQF